MATGACLLAGDVQAQDPLKVAPQSYRLQFENEWVRVIRVHYGPRGSVVAVPG